MVLCSCIYVYKLHQEEKAEAHYTYCGGPGGQCYLCFLIGSFGLKRAGGFFSNFYGGRYYTSIEYRVLPTTFM